MKTRTFNTNGVDRMKRNLFALQQGLANLIPTLRSDSTQYFERARKFFDLLLLKERVCVCVCLLAWLPVCRRCSVVQLIVPPLVFFLSLSFLLPAGAGVGAGEPGAESSVHQGRVDTPGGDSHRMFFLFSLSLSFRLRCPVVLPAILTHVCVLPARDGCSAEFMEALHHAFP